MRLLVIRQLISMNYKIVESLVLNGLKHMKNVHLKSERNANILNYYTNLSLFTCFKLVNDKEVLAIRRIFSPVDMITVTKFSNCPNVFRIGVVQQENMHSKQQNTFQSNSLFTIP